MPLSACVVCSKQVGTGGYIGPFYRNYCQHHEKEARRLASIDEFNAKTASLTRDVDSCLEKLTNLAQEQERERRSLERAKDRLAAHVSSTPN